MLNFSSSLFKPQIAVALEKQVGHLNIFCRVSTLLRVEMALYSSQFEHLNSSSCRPFEKLLCMHLF